MAKPITVKCYLSTVSLFIYLFKLILLNCLNQFNSKILQFRNEGIEIRRFLYKSSNDPTIQQLKDDVKQLYPQLRGEKFELMYLGELMALIFYCVVHVTI